MRALRDTWQSIDGLDKEVNKKKEGRGVKKRLALEEKNRETARGLGLDKGD
jgi:hypothetical protein